jgi:hypothetical protein
MADEIIMLSGNDGNNGIQDIKSFGTMTFY